MIKLLLTFKFFTVYRKTIKSVLTVFNLKEIEKIEKEKKIFMGIIINTTINKLLIVIIIIRIIKRVFIFIKINILINTVYRLINFFYCPYKQRNDFIIRKYVILNRFLFYFLVHRYYSLKNL